MSGMVILPKVIRRPKNENESYLLANCNSDWKEIFEDIVKKRNKRGLKVTYDIFVRALVDLKDLKIPMSEIFTSIQGEGPSTGKRATFIRFPSCNLSCSWCDSRDRRDKVNLEMTSWELFQYFKKEDPHLIVITGGEPALYQDQWALIYAAAYRHGCNVEVETNGTVKIRKFEWLYGWDYNISPKVNYFDMYKSWPNGGHNKVRWKFPLSPENYEETIRFIRRFHIEPIKTWAMPIGATKEEYEENYPFVLAMCEKNKWNFSSRLQVLHGIR